VPVKTLDLLARARGGVVIQPGTAKRAPVKCPASQPDLTEGIFGESL